MMGSTFPIPTIPTVSAHPCWHWWFYFEYVLKIHSVQWQRSVKTSKAVKTARISFTTLLTLADTLMFTFTFAYLLFAMFVSFCFEILTYTLN